MRKPDIKPHKKQEKMNVSFRLNVLTSSITAMMTAVLPTIIRPKIATNPKINHFNRLPEDIISHVIASFLNPTDTLELALLYKENLCSIKPVLPQLHQSIFLHHIARGEQDNAETLLKNSVKKDNLYVLLLNKTIFADYSGRTFECTAFEYAYWAKDKHMCLMLEKYMDEHTKSEILKLINTIEEKGLTYNQHGKTFTGSKHFDLTPLENAYRNYIQIYNALEQIQYTEENGTVVKEAWKNVGKAQRNLPVHYVNEYCRKDRSFDPRLEFNEPCLPRELIMYNFITDKKTPLFPLVLTDSSGLGIDFAFARSYWQYAGGGRGNICIINTINCCLAAINDVEAVIHLDAIRTNDMKQLRKNLESLPPKPGSSFK